MTRAADYRWASANRLLLPLIGEFWRTDACAWLTTCCDAQRALHKLDVRLPAGASRTGLHHHSLNLQASTLS